MTLRFLSLLFLLGCLVEFPEWVPADSASGIDLDGDGFFADQEDCDDTNANVNPNASEVCDEVDNDCDGEVDGATATDTTLWYPDADADGFGTNEGAISSCTALVGYATVGGDCDDASTLYYPGAAEADCTDPNDYNCDGSTGYADADGDGWVACQECDDGEAANYPGASEYCDGADNDCDSETDENDALDAQT